MIFTAIYAMMSACEVWNPTDLVKIDMPESLKEKLLAKAIKQATKFLQNNRPVDLPPLYFHLALQKI